MKKDEYSKLMLAMADYVEGRKLSGGTLVPYAEAGFNLACDFLAHEIRGLVDKLAFVEAVKE